MKLSCHGLSCSAAIASQLFRALLLSIQDDKTHPTEPVICMISIFSCNKHTDQT